MKPAATTATPAKEPARDLAAAPVKVDWVGALLGEDGVAPDGRPVDTVSLPVCQVQV